jgi:hypothetical protein
VDAVAELLARDEIRQLAERYALGVDSKDLDAIAALFVDDVDNGRFGPGRDGVKTFYDHVLRQYHCTMHFVGNHVIDFDDDDHAHGVVYCRAYHHELEPDHWFDLAFTYWDVYERSNTGWRFRRRRLKCWYRQSWGHPEEPGDRAHLDGTDNFALGPQLPEAFATWGPFWERPPRPIPEATSSSEAP